MWIFVLQSIILHFLFERIRKVIQSNELQFEICGVIILARLLSKYWKLFDLSIIFLDSYRFWKECKQIPNHPCQNSSIRVDSYRKFFNQFWFIWVYLKVDEMWMIMSDSTFSHPVIVSNIPLIVVRPNSWLVDPIIYNHSWQMELLRVTQIYSACWCNLWSPNHTSVWAVRVNLVGNGMHSATISQFTVI